MVRLAKPAEGSRDGAANAASAICAGYAHGLGRLKGVIHVGTARRVVDMAGGDHRVATAGEARYNLHKFVFPTLELDIWNVWRGHVRGMWWKGQPGEFEDEQGIEVLGERMGEQWSPLRGDRAWPHLNIMSIRAGHTSTAHAITDTGEWEVQSRPQLIENLLDPERDKHWKRAIFTADAGVGKTANAHWLWHAITEGTWPSDDGAIPARAPQFAFLLNLWDFPKDQSSILAELATRIAVAMGRERAPKFVDHILERARSDGRLTLVVDGLDHGSDRAQPAALRKALNSQTWQRCRFILSGRLYALHYHKSEQDGRIGIGGGDWVFARLREFTDDQAKRYLRTDSDGDARWQEVSPKLGELIHVPRILQYLKLIANEEIGGLRTSAEVFWKAYDQQLRESLKASVTPADLDDVAGEEPLPKGDPDQRRQKWLERELPRFHAIFGAIAYHMVAMEASENVQDAAAGGPPQALGRLSPLANFNLLELTPQTKREIAELLLSADVLGPAIARMRPNEARDAVNKYFETIGRLQVAVNETVKGYKDLRKERVHPAWDIPVPTRKPKKRQDQAEIAVAATDFTVVIWQNRTLQEFYAAYWICHTAARNPSIAARFERWMYVPEDHLAADAYYFVNQFVSEMPTDASDNDSWVEAAGVWYKPGRDKRPSEMLFRSWARMALLAGEPRTDAGLSAEDWWSVGYEHYLVARQNGYPARPHARGRAVIDGFRGELDQLLRDKNRLVPGRALWDLTAPDHWKHIAAGRYDMGLPDLKGQGFPGKTEAFWKRVIAEARSVIEWSPSESQRDQAGVKEKLNLLARRCLRRQWYFGPQGDAFRKAEVKDLAENMLAHVAKEGEEAVLERIRKAWRTQDETPRENPQKVADFDLHTRQVLHSWYRLFYPDHGEAVQQYLKYLKDTVEKEEKQIGLGDGGAEPVAIGTPQPDHPVIYVSWYDAWAFCQWARWTDPLTGKRYRARLPFEVEWEYACRNVGNGDTVPPSQTYWWNGGVYEKPDDPTPEHLSKPWAHADGRPGMTRAPASATANALGLQDMLGNVWEWMANEYHEEGYSRHQPEPGKLPAVNPYRAMRGGLWYFLDMLAHSTNRFKLQCNDRDYKMGFRIIREEVTAMPGAAGQQRHTGARETLAAASESFQGEIPKKRSWWSQMFSLRRSSN